MRSFRLATQVRLGAEGLTALDQFRDERVLLVTDGFLRTTPVFEQVLSRLGEHVTVFDDIVPNPTVATVSRGVASYMRCRPDVVVAYGGGSVIDTAKAMHKTTLVAGEAARHGLVAIPTTSGSGSEVTSFAVITDEESHTKIPLSSPDMVARLAILDPDAVVGVPPTITADSGMDVLTHAIEAYVARDACDFSDAFAEKAVELVFAHLTQCYRHGDDVDARSRMHNASCMAAMAFDNAGLGITHSLAHALGVHFAIAHGRLNAMLLPHVIAFNADHCERTARRYALLGRLVTPSASGRAAVTALTVGVGRLLDALDMPQTLRQAGVEAAEVRPLLSELAETALADSCTAPNPVAPGVDDLISLLRRIL